MLTTILLNSAEVEVCSDFIGVLAKNNPCPQPFPSCIINDGIDGKSNLIKFVVTISWLAFMDTNGHLLYMRNLPCAWITLVKTLLIVNMHDVRNKIPLEDLACALDDVMPNNAHTLTIGRVSISWSSTSCSASWLGMLARVFWAAVRPRAEQCHFTVPKLCKRRLSSGTKPKMREVHMHTSF